ncbi:MAG: B12-binding domain-containing radical SAM protein [Candidatus Omnitrophota bacterium]
MMKKKALLVNPWVYDFSCYDLFSKPLGLLEIASFLKANSFEVELIDCMDRLNPRLESFTGEKPDKGRIPICGIYHSEEVSKPGVFKDVPRKYKRHGMPEKLFKILLEETAKPDIILVTSGMTYWYTGVFEAISLLKEHFPGTPVMLGGIYATLCHGHASRHSGADMVFKGPDMSGIAKAVSALSGKDCAISDGRFMSAYELYPRLDYATLRLSSGCPYKCSYCGWYLLNPEFYQIEPEEAARQIDHFYRKMGIKNFAFYDEALFYNADNYIMEVLRILADIGVKANFYTPNGLHAKFLTKDLAESLRRSGFIAPRIGFESAYDTRQKTTGGKVDNRELVEAISLLKDAGYSSSEIGVNILIGLPDQSEREVEESMRFCHKYGVRVHLEEYSPVPGTPYFDRSGIALDADPLLHNNSAFPLYDKERYSAIQGLKQLNTELNRKNH